MWKWAASINNPARHSGLVTRQEVATNRHYSNDDLDRMRRRKEIEDGISRAVIL